MSHLKVLNLETNKRESLTYNEFSKKQFTGNYKLLTCPKIVDYGLSKYDLKNAKSKLQNQKDFLANNFHETGSGQIKSLLDLSYSANLSKRYYPRILNKVHTFISTCYDMELTPVFLTVTLDGFFRDLMKGDYTRYNKVKQQYKRHIPNNDRNGYYRDYMEQEPALTPKDLYKIISHQLHNFYMSYAMKQIKKRGDNYAAIRVTEPHHDGVPHLHILLYVPARDLSAIYKAFRSSFPSPRNHKVLTYKNTKGKNRRNAKEIYPDSGFYETFGFQTEIRSPAGYLLKYILKSFRNLIEDNELDYLQAWYIHNKIPRLISTHTLVSQDIYAAVAPLEDDWYYLTFLRSEHSLFIDREHNFFRFDDDDNDRQITGNNGVISIFKSGYLVSQYGTDKSPAFTIKTDKKYTIYKYSIIKNLPDNGFAVFGKDGLTELYCGSDSGLGIEFDPRKDNINDFYFDDRYFLPYDCDLSYDAVPFSMDKFSLSISMPVTKSLKPNGTMDEIRENAITVNKQSKNDYVLHSDLLDYYYNFDFDKFHPARYAVLHNELIKRVLIDALPVNPNDFNTDFEGDNNEISKK